MMKGRITIELGGVQTPLTFGMMAIEEFGNRQSIGAPGWSKLIVDLVYSGYCNNQVVEGNNPQLGYREIAEQMEDLMSANKDVIADIYKCFEESKAGSHFLSEVKKILALTEESVADGEVQPEGPAKKQTKKK